MFCTSCGKEIADGSKFCTSCGTPVAEAAPQPAAPSETPAAPEVVTTSEIPAAPAAPVDVDPTAGTKKGFTLPKIPFKPGKLLTALIAVAAVVVIALIVFVSIYNSPSLKVARAISKTSEAYTDMAEGINNFDAAALLEKQAYNMNMSFELSGYEELYYSDYGASAPAADVPAAEYGYDNYGTASPTVPTGIGVRMEAAMSLPKQDISMRLTPFYNSVDLTTVEAGLQGNYVFVGAEDLLGSDYFGVDTTTLGQALAEQDLIESEFDTLGFNFFDLVKIAEKYAQPDPEMEKAIEEANNALLKSIEVEKGSSSSINVNGKNTKCAVYKVTVTQDALEDYLHAVEKAMKVMDYEALYEELFAAMGIPEDMVEEAMDTMDMDAVDDVYGDMFDSINEVLDEMEDLELDLYISKGYVSAVKTEISIYDEEMEVEIYLGGDKNYVDDLSIAMTMDGETLEIISSGNHTGKGGTYDGELLVEFDGDTMFESEYSYSTKSGAFSLSAEMEDVTISAEGVMTTSKDSCQIDIEDLTIRQEDELEISMAYSYGISEYEPLVQVESPVLVLEKSEEELMELVGDIESNAMTFVEKITEIAPELVYMFM